LPALALISCCGLIFFLLRLEHERYPAATRALWIPTIWVAYVSSKPLSTWLIKSGRSGELGNHLEQVLILILLIVALRVLNQRKLPWLRALRENKALMLLIVFMLISILWSDIPFSSFKRWVRDFLAVIMGAVILSEVDVREAFESVLRRTVYLLIPLSLVLIKFFPVYGSDYHHWSGMKMWVGVCEHKNSLGQLASAGAFLLIFSFARKRRSAAGHTSRHQTIADVFIVIATLWILKGPGWYSATSIVVLAAGLTCLIGFLWMKKKHFTISANLLTAIIALIIVYGTSAFLFGKLPGGSMTSVVGRDSTLTDRTAIWKSLVPVALSKPILGHGFRGSWISSNPKYIGFSPHNGYLEVLLGLGFVGLILTSAFVLSSCRKAHALLGYDYDWGVFWICWLIMTLLNNIAESSIYSFSNLFMAVLVWLLIAINRSARSLS
jgi:exopolysaccharide production protein ExoQ